MGIVLKSERELAKMREAGPAGRPVLAAVEAACVPGVPTAELNAIAERELRRARATSAFLGYAPGGAPPYPAGPWTSVEAGGLHGVRPRRGAAVPGRALHFRERGRRPRDPRSAPGAARGGRGRDRLRLLQGRL